MKILGHELPALLCYFVKVGGFNKLIDRREFVRRGNSVNLKVNLYHYDGMWGKTSRFLSEHDRAMLGHLDTDHPPGNLDPQQCVIIGDLGVGQLLALDYRMKSMTPSVVTLQRGDNPVTNNRWVEIANSFDEFATTAGLENSHSNYQCSQTS